MRSTRFCSGAVRRWAPSALTNLDAQINGHGARPRPIGAHAVEFSKTAAPPGGASSVVARSGTTVPSGLWSLARPESRVQARRGLPPNAARNCSRLVRARWRLGCAGERRLGREARRGAPIARFAPDSGAKRSIRRFSSYRREQRRIRGPSPPPAYESTWTCTSRRRGRSSKSISTICCQVPSTNRPATSGTVSDGPSKEARRCA